MSRTTDLCLDNERLLLSEPEPTSPGGGPAGGGAHVGEAGQEKESDGLRGLPDHHLSRHPLLLLLHHPPGHSHLLWGSQLHGAQPFLRIPLGNISDKVRLKHFDHHPFGSVIIFEFLL